MTHFRTDFENVMMKDLAMFHLVLAAPINRLDMATTTQSTSLSAALSAPGTTNVHTGTTSSTRWDGNGRTTDGSCTAVQRHRCPRFLGHTRPHEERLQQPRAGRQ